MKTLNEVIESLKQIKLKQPQKIRMNEIQRIFNQIKDAREQRLLEKSHGY